MAVMNDLPYYLKEAMESFRRGGIMTVTAISTIAISLTVFGSFLLITMNLTGFVKTLESKIEITAYLEDGYTKEILEDMQRTIQTWPEVKELKYVSKEEALERLKKDFGEDNFFLNAIEENPLPSSFEIKLKNTETIDQIISKLEKEMVWVNEISYGREIVEKINEMTAMIKTLGSALVILLGIASLLIVANTVKLTVFARREEIEIMRLVGATNWFIRWPFIIEGGIQGFIGSVIAVLVIYSSYEVLFQRLRDIMPMLPLVNDVVLISKLCIKLMLIGAIVGVAGSLFSVRKFLRI